MNLITFSIHPPRKLYCPCCNRELTAAAVRFQDNCAFCMECVACSTFQALAIEIDALTLSCLAGWVHYSHGLYFYCPPVDVPLTGTAAQLMFDQPAARLPLNPGWTKHCGRRHRSPADAGLRIPTAHVPTQRRKTPSTFRPEHSLFFDEEEDLRRDTH